MDVLLTKANQALASAQAFWEENKGQGDVLPADKVAGYSKMLDEAEGLADQFRLQKRQAEQQERLGQFKQIADKQTALKEQALPESLKDEPALGEQIRLAGLNRQHGAEFDLDIGRTIRWMNLAEAGASPEEFALQVGAVRGGGTGAGNWIPDLFETYIVTGLRQIEGMSQVLNPMMTDDGNTIYIQRRTAQPAAPSSSNFASFLVAETAAAGTAIEGTYGRLALNVFKLFQRQDVSIELLEDSFINVAQEIGLMAGNWFGEVFEYSYTNGTGNNQPQGAFSAYHEAGLTRQDTNAAATGTPDLLDFHRLTTENSRLQGGQSNYSFITNRAVWGNAVRDIGTNYLPWWGIGLNSAGAMMAFGYPVYYGSAIDSAISAGSVPVGFGNWNRLMRARQVNTIRMTVSDIAESNTDEISYRFRVRFGNEVIDPERAEFLVTI